MRAPNSPVTLTYIQAWFALDTQTEARGSFARAPTPLAKVTGVIVTARVRRRAAGGCDPLRPTQRKIFRCLGVKRPVS